MATIIDVVKGFDILATGDTTGLKAKQDRLPNDPRLDWLRAGGPGSGRRPGGGSQHVAFRDLKVGDRVLVEAPYKPTYDGDEGGYSHADNGVITHKSGNGPTDRVKVRSDYGSNATQVYNSGVHRFYKQSSDMEAGGPGSGCRGENCGRHGGGRGTDKTHLPKDVVVDRKKSDIQGTPYDRRHLGIATATKKAADYATKIGATKEAAFLNKLHEKLMSGKKVTNTIQNQLFDSGDRASQKSNLHLEKSTLADDSDNGAKFKYHEKMSELHENLADKISDIENKVIDTLDYMDYRRERYGK